ncbi:hypothetical protein [Streptococcus pluranimalium]|uniref:hypothetical protein n=1 Tax=Streptococcus pluranimalium TaxID=82348 RepID=UPI003BF8309A
MKKIGSCQLLKTVCLVILGGMLVMGLAGCDVRKNSRAYLEGKAAELDRVFPTENLEDLFEEFPGGFTFSTIYWMDDKDGWGYGQIMKVEGNPDNERISGLVQTIRTTAKPSYREEILKESTFDYRDGKFIFNNPEFSMEDLKTEGFIIENVEITKNKLSKAKLLSKAYNLETDDGAISYQFIDSKLNHYLKMNNNEVVNLSIDIDNETIHDESFQYGLRFKYGNVNKFTIGFSGFKNARE